MTIQSYRCARAAALTIVAALACRDAPTGVDGRGIGPLPVFSVSEAYGSGESFELRSQVADNRCMDVAGASRTNGARLIIWECLITPGTPAPQQTFRWSSATGQISVYDGTPDRKCVLVAGDNGSIYAGAKVEIWECDDIPHYLWEPTSDGSGIRLRNSDLCLDVPNGDPALGNGLIVWNCWGGTPQRWDALPPGGGRDLRQQILDFTGPALSVADAEVLGGPFARYENDFRLYEPRRWETDGSDWGAANYYDRARIYYVWYARTGDTTYLTKANAVALDYRRNYIEAENYGTSAYWAMIDGLALHYVATGDTASRTAVGYIANTLSAPYYLDQLADTLAPAEMDARTQARVLSAFVLAHRLDAPSRDPGYTNAHGGWAGLARSSLDEILRSQSPSGGYPKSVGGTSSQSPFQCGYVKPFMDATLDEALIQYHTHFEKDARILPAVRRNLDFLWANAWDPGSRSYVYLTGPCGGSGPGPAPDLTNMMTPPFGWVYLMTRDTVYRSRGDQSFSGGVAGAYLLSSKQFNQAYWTSWRYAAYRQQAGGGPVTEQLGPVMIAGEASGRCMELGGGSRSAGDQLRLWDCWGGDNQRYISMPSVGQTGELRHKYSDMCLQPANDGVSDGEAVVIQPCTGSSTQRWTRTETGALRQINGRCLDVSGAGTGNGTPNIVSTCSGGAGQKWSWRS